VAAHFGEVAAPGLTATLQISSRLDHDAQGGITACREALKQALVSGRERDLRRRFTGSGPHLDDLVLMIQDRPARVHASQGQCRALILAMKIAEIRSLEERLGEAPVLLMDDVSSELDRQRNQALMGHLDALGGQVFLTTTDAAHIGLTSARAVFRMVAGQCSPGGGPQEDDGAGIPD
jgi:DNA replication and repair protein RecF